MKLKILMLSSLIFLGLMGYCFEAISKGFVVFEPFGEYVYMKDVQGSMSDGGVMIGVFGEVCIILGSSMIFVKKQKYLVRIGSSVYLFLLFTLMLIEGDSIDQLFINTIKYDQNIYLILWLISIFVYTILLIIFSRNTDESKSNNESSD